MQPEIPVEVALRRGRWMVTYPGMLILFSLLGLSIWVADQETFPLWTKPTSLIVSFVFSWLYWSFMITKWKIWAYSNVIDVHELRQKAIDEQLIWPPGSLIEKTEIRSRTDREILESLNKRFEKHDSD